MLVTRIAVVALLALCATARAQDGLEALTITTASGRHDFGVEVMRDDASREKGLMYRRFLPADRGMLFDFGSPQPVMMWMKNTYISLDMVFIKPDGKVLSTAENAEPMSERVISSKGQALGVLEVNAGVVAKLHIKAGDTVESSMFGK